MSENSTSIASISLAKLSSIWIDEGSWDVGLLISIGRGGGKETDEPFE
jgi:hypothetical protein